jgi:hypothetical protein
MHGQARRCWKTLVVAYMKQEELLASSPRGFEEGTLTCMHQDCVFIQKQTGFIRLCLQCRVAVGPLLVFGKNDYYWNIQGGWSWNWRLALNRCDLPTILAWDCSCIPLLPKRNTPLLIAVGETINLS